MDELTDQIARRRTHAEDHLGQEVPLLFAVCEPCQSFTKYVQRSMTKQKTPDRARDRNLLAQAVDFIKEFKPEMILSENVADIERSTYGQVWIDFQNELLNLGYLTGKGKVDASRFGVPQHRRGSVIMAIETDRENLVGINLPITVGSDGSPSTVRDTIGELPPCAPVNGTTTYRIIGAGTCRTSIGDDCKPSPPENPTSDFSEELALRYCSVCWVVYRARRRYARGYGAFVRVNLQAQNWNCLPNLPHGGQGGRCPTGRQGGAG